ncbi:MAG: AF1514 family protein, partial [Gammaproteobacteria bacterium]|nr:AF1514 family protein [Gammaproteobacteria bacterium]
MGDECGSGPGPDRAGLSEVALAPDPPPVDYRAAMTLAQAEADARLGECMLLSWYDWDRDFESPQHAGECHRDSAVPGYVDYALYR